MKRGIHGVLLFVVCDQFRDLDDFTRLVKDFVDVATFERLEPLDDVGADVDDLPDHMGL